MVQKIALPIAMYTARSLRRDDQESTQVTTLLRAYCRFAVMLEESDSNQPSIRGQVLDAHSLTHPRSNIIAQKNLLSVRGAESHLRPAAKPPIPSRDRMSMKTPPRVPAVPPCLVISRVFITSRGVVSAPDVAPAIAPHIIDSLRFDARAFSENGGGGFQNRIF